MKSLGEYMISHNELLTKLQYCKITGIFKWNINPKGHNILNKQAGIKYPSGYRAIKLNQKLYLEHRLAWFYIYGEWPKNCIDHINGIRDDNRIDNLRNATQSENNRNRIEHRNGNLVGVYFHKKIEKYRSQIQINGKRIHLGYYNTEIEAHNKYIEVREKEVVN